MAASTTTHAQTADAAADDVDWVLVDDAPLLERNFTPVHEQPPCSTIHPPAGPKARCHTLNDIEDSRHNPAETTKECSHCSGCTSTTKPTTKTSPPPTSPSTSEHNDPVDPSAREHSIAAAAAAALKDRSDEQAECRCADPMLLQTSPGPYHAPPETY